MQRTNAKWIDLCLLVVLTGVWLLGVYALVIGIDNPILDDHPFRQTQTAITAYYLWQGGPALAYDTPVLGFPWSLPFEFPTYQYIVAGLAILDVPIDVGGRVVSYLFLIGCLWPIHMLYRTLQFDRTAFLVTAILMLASPLHVFWARTVMIETTVLFLSLAWLAFFARVIDRPSVAAILLTVGLGCLAALTKSTTYPGVCIIALTILAFRLVKDAKAGDWRSAAVHLGTAGTVTGVPVVVGYAWIVWTDAIREQNPLGALTIAKAITHFTLGTLDQRVSARFWHDAVLYRMVPGIFGQLVLAPIIAIAATVTNARYLGAAIACVATFVAILMVFTNLHFVHNYYQMAIAVFLLAACAFGITALFTSGHHTAAVACLLLVVGSQVHRSLSVELPLARWNTRETASYQIAQIVMDRVPEGSAIIVLGRDWSSEISYYARRRSITVPNWAPAAYQEQLVRSPESLLGGMPLGGVVACRTSNAMSSALIERITEGRTLIAEKGGCRLLSSTRSAEFRHGGN